MSDLRLNADIAMLLARFTLGFFFISYRFRWFFDPTPQDGVKLCSPFRHENLIKKMVSCGFPAWRWLAASVASVEFMAGLGLIFGLFTSLSALGLAVILLVATSCTAKEKTLRQKPVDAIDVVNCYFWNPEPVYITLALVVLLIGPGNISLDYLWRIYLG